MIIDGQDLPKFDDVAYWVAEKFYPGERRWEVSFEDFRIAILREVVKHSPKDKALAFEIAAKKAEELLAEPRSMGWSPSVDDKRYHGTMPSHVANVDQEYTDFTTQLEVAKGMSHEAQRYSEHEKVEQALDIFKSAILKMARVPGLLQPCIFMNAVSGQPNEVEVLCFKPLIRAEKGIGLAVLCLFRDGLYWVPIRDSDYLFAERVPITDAELFFEFDSLKKAIHARIQELGSQPTQDAVRVEDDSTH